jgi:hypothetical protein
MKKARKVLADGHLAHGHHADGHLAEGHFSRCKLTKSTLAKQLFELAAGAQSRGWSAEELLAGEIKKRERDFRHRERP